jgi:hypothetical protein
MPRLALRQSSQNRDSPTITSVETNHWNHLNAQESTVNKLVRLFRAHGLFVWHRRAGEYRGPFHFAFPIRTFEYKTPQPESASAYSPCLAFFSDVAAGA